MTVEEMERRFYELKGKLDVGAITEEDFRLETEKLRFQDSQNRWWMIGAQSGKWYFYDGTRWIPGRPPTDVPASPPPPPPQPAGPPHAVPLPSPTPSRPRPTAVPPRPAPIAPPKPVPALPVERAPTQPAETLSAPAPPARLPVPYLIGCMGAAALLSLCILLFTTENYLPGRPLSSFVGGLTGGPKPTPGAGATRVVAAPTPADKNGINVLLAAGDQFALQSQFDTAIAQYASASQIAPSSPLPLTRWSRVLAWRGQPLDALSKAQEAIDRGPNDVEAQAQLARMLVWNGQVDEGIVLAEKAVALDAKSANAHTFLAEAYFQAKRPADARAQAQAALQLAPQSAEAHRIQAWLLAAAGQREAARAEWNQSAALEPNLFLRHFELAEALRVYLNAPADAVAEYQKAIALYGAYTPAYSHLGLALLDVNQPQAAARQFQRAITLDPNNAETIALLGLAFQKSDECPQAIPYFEQALSINSNNSLAQNGLNDCRSGKPTSQRAPKPTSVPLIPPTVAPPVGGNAPAVAPSPPPPPEPYPSN
jgi:tetratricopeptide (TPR) repeat protein